MDSWLESCALLASIFAVIPSARFQRRCPVPDHSFFLFGPRGTGKSAWLRHVLPDVQDYFDVLVDTLIGFWLPAWQRRAKVKEVASAKLYLFNPGVARALAGRAREPLDGSERGFLLETWVLHELRAAMSFHNAGGQLHYWRTSHGSEVNFIGTRAKRAVGIEVKASERWGSEFGTPLKGLVAEGIVQTGFGAYAGQVELQDGPLRVLPLSQFLKALSTGALFS